MEMNPRREDGEMNPRYEGFNEPKPRPKALPAVLHSFPTLRRGNQQLRVRILQYPKSEILLDIREFITGESFNGFSKKGLSLNLEQVLEIHQSLPLIIKALKGEY